MASAIPLRPLTCQHGIKFLASRNKCTQISNASSPIRFITHFTGPHHHRLHLPLSLCSLLLLPRPALSPLLRTRSPHFRPSLTLMTTTQAASESPQSSTKTVRLVIKGRVQGVFYRNWTIENATQLGLKGWVRNRRDGSVETLLSGNSDAVQEMEQRCRRGPPSAMVTGLEVYPSTDDPGSGFELKQTV
ncbi:PREDICTED: uncharacterized protein LOC101296128 [Fragaria vesca subsp. vesca]|uniref:uncharacterized protein LOC101296128 n=1 Tax=Fragaria vesca subsp. vesca TaxID=101020 RepID=UPI0002C34598|nr:PREDICTED: uncharacterized protein LOC101296128 [Fragaria vesca subsp. vesca]